MSEPKWLTDLDLFVSRATRPAVSAAYWATYLVTRLPLAERSRIVRAMLNGTTPGEYDHERKKKEADER